MIGEGVELGVGEFAALKENGAFVGVTGGRAAKAVANVEAVDEVVGELMGRHGLTIICRVNRGVVTRESRRWAAVVEIWMGVCS